MNDRSGDRVPNGLGSVPGECRTVLDGRDLAVTLHAWKVQQQRKAGGSFDKGADRGAMESEEEVTFPMAWHRAIVSFGGTFADHDGGSDEAFAAPTRSRSRDA
jgi:hypothetical protein